MPYYLSPPPSNPLSKLIAAIIAVLALMGSFMIGFAVFLIVAAIGLVLGIVIWVRVALIKRRLRKEGFQFNPPDSSSQQSGQVIDAEYTVINESEEQDRR